MSPDELLASARNYIARKEWTFASTMPKNPHHYVVAVRGADRGHDALDLLIECGPVRRWHGHRFRSLRLDGFDYWRIPPVINRKPTGSDVWDRSDNGGLPDEVEQAARIASERWHARIRLTEPFGRPAPAEDFQPRLWEDER